jgi:hypothetical protein
MKSNSRGEKRAGARAQTLARENFGLDIFKTDGPVAMAPRGVRCSSVASASCRERGEQQQEAGHVAAGWGVATGSPTPSRALLPGQPRRGFHFSAMGTASPPPRSCAGCG